MSRLESKQSPSQRLNTPLTSQHPQPSSAAKGSLSVLTGKYLTAGAKQSG